jgi:tetratricopeptide (TPR) repeat protein
VTEGDVGMAADATETASHDGVLDGPAPLGPEPGARVGRYRVERTLGSGGMGVVVQAHDPELDRLVALKLVRADIGDHAYRDRLVREARAMAQLEHPNVVRVYDAGVAGGEVFVAMELMRGDSLGRWMREAPRPWREVVARFVAAGRGLAAAHAVGLVHRDFKPDNVLVGAIDARVCVTDFGLAVPSGAIDDLLTTVPDPLITGDENTMPAAGRNTPASPRLTRTGAAVGTPAYMAPEQYRGEVDQRADVYSFCVSLYEGLYGERPFAIDPKAGDQVAAWVETIARGRVRPVPPGRRVPAALRRALVRGLAADPDQRWPSMAPLLRALERVRTRRVRIAIGAAAVLALGASAVGAIALTRGASAPVADPCVADAARIDSIWNADERARVEHALTAGGQAYAAFAAHQATGELDRWSAVWSDASQTACHEAASGALPHDAYQTRTACLDDGLATMRARIALLEGGGALDHAIEYATVPNPSTCETGDRDPRPTEPALAKRISVVEEELRRVTAARFADDYLHGAPLARAALAEARAIGWRPLIDEAGFELVELDDSADESLDEAAALAREVAESVTGAGDWEKAARMWRLAMEVAEQSGKLDGLDYLISAARGASKHMRDPDDRLMVEAAIGAAYVAAERIPEARTTCEAALREAERITSPGAEAEGKALGCLMEAADREGQYDAVPPLTERELAFDLRVRGPRHPKVMSDLANLGVAFSHQGRLRDALLVRVAVHGVTLESQGTDSAAAADSWASLAESYASLDDKAAARDAADRAVTIAKTKAGTPDDPTLVNALQVQGYALDAIGDPVGGAAVLHELFELLADTHPGTQQEIVAAINGGAALEHAHRCAEALPMLDRATSDGKGTLPADMALVLEAQRAACRIQVKRPADALRDLEPAWKRADTRQVAAAERAPIEAVLAQALEETGDRVRALDFALRARDDATHDEAGKNTAELDAQIARLRAATR